LEDELHNRALARTGASGNQTQLTFAKERFANVHDTERIVKRFTCRRV
jgi:ribosomal protein S28E/S33